MITHLKSLLKTTPVQTALRLFARLIYPELWALDTNDFTFSPLISSRDGSIISKKARLSPPYRVDNSNIGDYTYISPGSSLSMTTIGKFCSIGPRLSCGWGIHPLTGVSTSPMFYSTKGQNGYSLTESDKFTERRPICIGNDVFIGMDVIILDGVCIGDGAVIGAGTIVSKDVPPYAVAAGAPLKIIRYRFSKEIISSLLAIRWWDWPEDKLAEVERHFFDIQKFVDEHYIE